MYPIIVELLLSVLKHIAVHAVTLAELSYLEGYVQTQYCEFVLNTQPRCTLGVSAHERNSGKNVNNLVVIIHNNSSTD